MEVGKEHVSNILANYGVLGSLEKVFYLIEHYREGTEPQAKVIVKAEMNNGETYIVKFVLEKEHPQSLIEEQSIFSENIRKSGINTPRRLKCGGQYCINFKIDEIAYAVTVEEYLGEELSFINHDIIGQIADLMANMHQIAVANNCHINGNTIWDLFDSSTDITRGYNAFCEYRNCGKYNFSTEAINLHDKIVDLYQQRLARLKQIWPKLPRYATQGDYSINNLTYKDGNVDGIFDYNIAGDEVLVADMVIQGLFVSYEMDLDVGLTEKDRDGLFRTFIDKYMRVRKLSKDELSVMNDIYAVIFPFWWERIIYDETESLQSHFKSKNSDKVDEFMRETYELLNQDYFSFIRV